MQAIINTIIQLAQQAGQSVMQWLQSPQGQHFLKHLGHEVAERVYDYFKDQYEEYKKKKG